MIMGMLGGKMGPSVAAAAVMLAATSSLYPCSFMALIWMLPSAPISARAAPEIPAITKLASTFT